MGIFGGSDESNVHLKSDGTLDLRYKQAEKEGFISKLVKKVKRILTIIIVIAIVGVVVYFALKG